MTRGRRRKKRGIQERSERGMRDAEMTNKTGRENMTKSEKKGIHGEGSQGRNIGKKTG